MGRVLTLVWLACVMAVAGCSDSSCPADYPVEMDGFCYRADGGGMMPVDGSTGDGSTGTDGGGGDGDGGPGDDASAICSGTHPLLDGDRRYCETGDCFCATPDSCFVQAIATSCCEVDVVCTDTDGGLPSADAGMPPPSDGGGVICSGTHPLLDGERRYCETGDCFCADPDSCFPAEIASSCCTVAVVCE